MSRPINPGFPLALLCALGASACFLFNPDEGRYACNPGVCPSDFVCGDDHRCWRHVPPRDLAVPADLPTETPGGTVSIMSPKETAYTHASIHIEVSVSDDSVAVVDLLVDGNSLATLTAPFQYDWDTTQVPEGPHGLVARARIGGLAVDSDPRTVVVDRTPPTVILQAPAPGAATVLVHAPITVQFSEAIAPATATDQTVTLTTGSNTAMPKTLAVSADGRTLTIMPSALSTLALPALFTGGVTAGIEDLAGNPLQVPTTAWTWTVPPGIVIGAPFRAQPPGPPAIAVDQNGNPVVVYHASGSSQPSVRRWDGSTWVLLGGGPVSVTSASEFFSALTIDGSNAPVLVFLSGDPTYTKGALYVARWDGTTWKAGSAPINPNETGATPPAPVGDDFAIATDPVSGNAIVVVNQNGLNLYKVDQSTKVTRMTSTLNEPGTSIPITGTSSPAIAVDPGGNVFVSYLHSDATTMNAYVTEWAPNGKGWLPQGGAINPVTGQNCLRGQETWESRNWLALDKTNAPTVAILESDGTHNNVYVKRLNGPNWQQVGGAINAVSGHDTSAPSLVINRSGTPFVAFYELDAVNGIVNDVFVSRFNGTNWATVAGPLNPVAGVGGPSDGGVGLALDAMGKPIIYFLGSELNTYIVAVNN